MVGGLIIGLLIGFMLGCSFVMGAVDSIEKRYRREPFTIAASAIVLLLLVIWLNNAP